MITAKEARAKSQEVVDHNSPLHKLMGIIIYNINKACEKGEFECVVVYPICAYGNIIEDAMHKLRMNGYTVREVMDGLIKISW